MSLNSIFPVDFPGFESIKALDAFFDIEPLDIHKYKLKKNVQYAGYSDIISFDSMNKQIKVMVNIRLAHNYGDLTGDCTKYSNRVVCSHINRYDMSKHKDKLKYSPASPDRLTVLCAISDDDRQYVPDTVYQYIYDSVAHNGSVQTLNTRKLDAKVTLVEFNFIKREGSTNSYDPCTSLWNPIDSSDISAVMANRAITVTIHGVEHRAIATNAGYITTIPIDSIEYYEMDNMVLITKMFDESCPQLLIKYYGRYLLLLSAPCDNDLPVYLNHLSDYMPIYRSNTNGVYFIRPLILSNGQLVYGPNMTKFSSNLAASISITATPYAAYNISKMPTNRPALILPDGTIHTDDPNMVDVYNNSVYVIKRHHVNSNETYTWCKDLNIGIPPLLFTIPLKSVFDVLTSDKLNTELMLCNIYLSNDPHKIQIMYLIGLIAGIRVCDTTKLINMFNIAKYMHDYYKFNYDNAAPIISRPGRNRNITIIQTKPAPPPVVEMYELYHDGHKLIPRRIKNRKLYITEDVFNIIYDMHGESLPLLANAINIMHLCEHVTPVNSDDVNEAIRLLRTDIFINKDRIEELFNKLEIPLIKFNDLNRFNDNASVMIYYLAVRYMFMTRTVPDNVLPIIEKLREDIPFDVEMYTRHTSRQITTEELLLCINGIISLKKGISSNSVQNMLKYYYSTHFNTESEKAMQFIRGGTSNSDIVKIIGIIVLSLIIIISIVTYLTKRVTTNAAVSETTNPTHNRTINHTIV